MGWNLLLFAFTGAGVLAGCMVPNRWLPPLPNDKLLHFAAFGLLSAMALRIAHGWAEAGFWLAGLALAGWLIECLQGLVVADRRFCWRDIVANVAGIGFVAVCAGLYDMVS